MIELRSLVQTVHASVEAAIHAVTRSNIDTFQSYFTKGAKVAPAASSSADAAVAAPVAEAGFAEIGPGLDPQTVKLEFVRSTPDGPVPHTVTVPLISLVPYSSLQPTEIKFEIDLECVEKDGQVLVAFPQVRRTVLGKEQVVAVRKNARLEITINAVGRTPAVAAIIEGYDRLIRAQIPD